ISGALTNEPFDPAIVVEVGAQKNLGHQWNNALKFAELRKHFGKPKVGVSSFGGGGKRVDHLIKNLRCTLPCPLVFMREADIIKRGFSPDQLVTRVIYASVQAPRTCVVSGLEIRAGFFKSVVQVDVLIVCACANDDGVHFE